MQHSPVRHHFFKKQVTDELHVLKLLHNDVSICGANVVDSVFLPFIFCTLHSDVSVSFSTLTCNSVPSVFLSLHVSVFQTPLLDYGTLTSLPILIFNALSVKLIISQFWQI